MVWMGDEAAIPPIGVPAGKADPVRKPEADRKDEVVIVVIRRAEIRLSRICNVPGGGPLISAISNPNEPALFQVEMRRQADCVGGDIEGQELVPRLLHHRHKGSSRRVETIVHPVVPGGD